MQGSTAIVPVKRLKSVSRCGPFKKSEETAHLPAQVTH
jgi:hypothetical protein